MTIDPRRVKDLFVAALDQPDLAARQAFLDRQCAGESVLRERLDVLLQAHDAPASALNRPLAEIAPEVHDPALTTNQSIPEISGAVIGPYKLVEQIGEGGMGAVWMAQQSEPVKRVVALKLIKAGMDSRQVIARFEAERQTLALMDHPNIAKVLDAGTTSEVRGQRSEIIRTDEARGSPLTSDLRPLTSDSGRPYFVMELVKGVPLTRYCDEHHLTPRQRLELFVPVCQAIQHAHQKGIIHRDIKPSNVLVALYDDKPVPKVIDFGVAKATGQQLTEHTLNTGFGAVVGTLEYMSPEQAGFNQLDIDTRSDIYSLGVLLYELLAGSPPFTRKELEQAGVLEMLRVIREQEPSRPSTKLSSSDALPSLSANRGTEPAKLTRLVRGELDWIVMKALEKDRARRYETANGFAQDLQRYLADEPVQACPPSAWYRLRKFARRKKAALSVAACLLLAIAGLAGGLGWVVEDRVSRRVDAARRGRECLTAVQSLLAANKLTAAREKLAEAKAQIGNFQASLSSLVAEIETVDAELDRFQRFIDLIDRAHEEEIGSAPQAMLAADLIHGMEQAPPPQKSAARHPEKAVPFLLEALAMYEILEHDDWRLALERGPLGPDQMERVQTMVYEELLWLADDSLRRREDHRLRQQLTSQSAAQQSLAYVTKTATAHVPTTAYYRLRWACRAALQEQEAARADELLMRQTAATTAYDFFLLGLAAYDRGNKAEAQRQFEAALRRDPSHYWSLMQLGSCLGDLGQQEQDYVASATAFTGCIMKRPDHAHAYFCRGNAYGRLQRYDEAIADYSKATELDPLHAPARTGLGRVYHGLKRWDEAIASFDKSIELDPKYARAWMNRGVTHIDLQKLDKAVADFSKAVELDPKDPLARFNRGIVYESLKQSDQALADYSIAIELDPTNSAAWNNRGLVYDQLQQREQALANYSKAIELDPKNAAAWVNRANTYNTLKQWDQALADCSQAIELDGKLAAAWKTRARTYHGLQQLDQAIADYSTAIELDPNDALVHKNLGVALYTQKKLEEAVASYRKAIELQPNFADAHEGLGLVLRAQEKLADAEASFRKAISLDPKSPSAHANLGVMLQAQKRLDDAIQCHRTAIELAPLDPRGHFNLATALYAQEKVDEAIASYRRVIELDPKYAGAQFNLGTVLKIQGKLDDAIACFRSAIEVAPEDFRAHNKLGEVLLQQGKLDEAMACFRKAIEIEPTFPYSHNSLGAALAKQGRLDEAIQCVRKAIELSPRFALAHRNLGHVLFAQQKLDEAIASFRKVIELEPQDAGTLNTLAWHLATTADHKLRNPTEALKFAEVSVRLTPEDGEKWNTVGVARYRNGDWNGAIEALNKSCRLRKGGDGIDWLFLAMAHQKQDKKEEARLWYDRAIEWMDKNQPKSEEIRRFRAEAEEALGIKKSNEDGK